MVVTDSICLSYFLFVYYFVHGYGCRFQSSTVLCVVVLRVFIAFYTVLSLLVLKGLRLPKMAFTWLILVTIRPYKFNSMFDKPAAHNVFKRKQNILFIIIPFPAPGKVIEFFRLRFMFFDPGILTSRPLPFSLTFHLKILLLELSPQKFCRRIDIN